MLTDSLSADEVIAKLRAHEDELRRAGIMSLSLFGSVARGDADLESDVDLVGLLDPGGACQSDGPRGPRTTPG